MGQTFNAMGWQDREVKVKRDELLAVLKNAVLKNNRDKHIDDFKQACSGYRAEAMKARRSPSSDFSSASKSR